MNQEYKGTKRTVIVCFDWAKENEHPVLIVGEKNNGAISIINAFRDKDAIDIYERLVNNADA